MAEKEIFWEERELIFCVTESEPDGSVNADAVSEAYGYLKRSIELEKNKSRDAVMVTFITASITLNQKGRIDDNQVIEDYFMVTEIIDGLLE